MSRLVYLIRHGALALPGPERRCIGHTDYDLSPVGQQQARALRAYFNDHPVCAVFSSPLTRCVHTAQICFDPKPVRQDRELREVDMGLWDGLCFSEIQSRWPERYAARGRDFCNTAAPEGESFLQAGERFCAAVEHILTQTTGNLAIVAHAGVNRMLLCRLMQIPPNDLFSISQPYGCINLLEQADDRLRVIRVGVVPGQQEANGT